jgi:uncharacterized protein YegP (UPF0339 family)
MTVTTCNLKASNGKHIRKATVVRCNNGTVITFTERLSNKEAVRQAVELLKRQGFFKPELL